MTFERVPEMRDAYGETVMYLIGGALLRERSDLPAACRKLIDAIRSSR
ncbi:hypothetical protein LP421_01595 (plasmid) [Rhizobium sp. RCAM05350]|nr:hypothetical protein LP421_01595 [Rhizobium sp. RCAM05350]